MVAGLMGLFSETVEVMLFDPLLHGSPCFTNVDFATLAGNPVTTPSCLAGLMVSFGLTKYDRSVLSDLRWCECLVILGSGGEAPKLPGYKVKWQWT